MHEGLRASVHALHARLGSIHIAVTAVTELGLEGEARDQMLVTAAEESVRAAAELTGISCLVSRLMEPGPNKPCDVAALLRAVGDAAALRGQKVDIDCTGAPTVTADEAALRSVLGSLVALAAGAGGDVAVSAEALSPGVRLAVSRIGPAGDEELPVLARHLIRAVGGEIETVVNEGTGVTFLLGVG